MRYYLLIFSALVCFGAVGQKKLTFNSFGGIANFEYSLPLAKLDPKKSSGYSMGFSLSTNFHLTNFLFLHTESGIIKNQNDIGFITIINDGTASGFSGEYYNMHYQLVKAYFLIAPEIRPFKKKLFFFRAGITLNLTLDDEFTRDENGFAGMVFYAPGFTANFDVSTLNKEIHHPYLYLLDIGYDFPVMGNGLSLTIAGRMSIIPQNKDAEKGLFPEVFQTELPNIGVTGYSLLFGISQEL